MINPLKVKAITAENTYPNGNLSVRIFLLENILVSHFRLSNACNNFSFYIARSSYIVSPTRAERKVRAIFAPYKIISKRTQKYQHPHLPKRAGKRNP